jgi:hypothetical protein
MNCPPDLGLADGWAGFRGGVLYVVEGWGNLGLKWWLLRCSVGLALTLTRRRRGRRGRRRELERRAGCLLRCAGLRCTPFCRLTACGRSLSSGREQAKTPTPYRGKPQTAAAQPGRPQKTMVCPTSRPKAYAAQFFADLEDESIVTGAGDRRRVRGVGTCFPRWCT